MPEKPESDLLGSLIDRIQDGTAGHLDRQMRSAPDIKRQEEEASQRRLEEMWMHENERQQAIAEAQSEQQRQEEMLVRVVLVVVGIVILIVILVAIGLSLAG